MPKVKPRKVCKGYVVKREIIEERDDPKHPGNKLRVKVRREISRVFHAISAAETYLAMCKKEWPDGDFLHPRENGRGRPDASADVSQYRLGHSLLEEKWD